MKPMFISVFVCIGLGFLYVAWSLLSWQICSKKVVAWRTSGASSLFIVLERRWENISSFLKA